MPPAMVGGFLTSGPPGKSTLPFLEAPISSQDLLYVLEGIGSDR